MGAWGAGIFDNDDACDFAASVAGDKDLSRIEGALDKVLAIGSSDIEAPDAIEALAAADIVARLLGKATAKSAHTEAIDAWVSEIKQEPSEFLINKARSVVTRVQYAPSELLELWQKSNEFAAWKQSLKTLADALKP